MTFETPRARETLSANTAKVIMAESNSFGRHRMIHLLARRVRTIALLNSSRAPDAVTRWWWFCISTVTHVTPRFCPTFSFQSLFIPKSSKARITKLSILIFYTYMCHNKAPGKFYV
jgi:hypothetical protein